MTLEEQIKANTQRMAELKQQMETAISDKGGVITPSGDSPTFEEVIAGVDTIETGIKVNGVSNLQAQYLASMSEGDTCYIEKPIVEGSDYVLTVKSNMPTEAIDGDTVRTINTASKPFFSNGGNNVILFADNYGFPFMWDGKKYIQMTINGSYKHFSELYLFNVPNTINQLGDDNPSAYACAFYGNRAYCCKYDEPAIAIYDVIGSNLVLHGIYNLIAPVVWVSPIFPVIYNNNLFVTGFAKSSSTYSNAQTLQFYFDETADTMTYIANSFEWISPTSTYLWTASQLIADYEINSNGDLCVLQGGSIDTAQSVKQHLYCICLSLDAQGVYRKKYTSAYDAIRSEKYNHIWHRALTSSLVNDKYFTKMYTENYSQNSSYSSLFNPNVCFDNEGEYVFCRMSTGVIKVVRLTYGSTSVSTTSLTRVYSDGLVESSITGFRLIKGTNLIFIYSTSSALLDIDKTRLYSFNISDNTITFTYLKSVPSMSSPATQILVLPYIWQYFCKNLIGVPLQSSLKGEICNYKLRNLVGEFEYTARPCNNKILTKTETFVGYGVVKETVVSGEAGEVSLIIANNSAIEDEVVAQTEEINTQTEDLTELQTLVDEKLV